MKKILILGYYRCNLGDDLFLYITSKRYKDIELYIYVNDEEDRKPFLNIENVKIIKQYIDYNSVDIKQYDGVAYIGGSVFMESDYSIHEAKELNKFLKKLKEANKPFFYITCNFGPYKTKEYKDLIGNNLKLCTNVCFRGKQSYEEFKDLDSVSYAPDIVFSHDFSNITSKKEKKTIGISVIDPGKKEDNSEKIDIYYDYIKRIAIKFAKRNYKVSLISFCKHEGDEGAIEQVLGMIPDEYEENINVLKYTGNIEEFLREYSKLEYMVCTRFHSMVLSFIFKQKIYNLVYSNKSKEPLDDYKIHIKTDEVSKLEYETCLRKYQFRKIGSIKLNKIKRKSNKQFEAFEKYFKG